MRIFIHKVDSFLGKALVQELRKADGGLNRIFGTATNAKDAPSAVKRLVNRDDSKRAKKMAETMQSCRLVILDVFGSSIEDLLFAIQALKVDPTASPPKSTGELEGDVVFIVVSSVTVWGNTEPSSEDGILRDKDYLSRRPVASPKYEQWKAIEDLALQCFNREGSQVKCFVVAGGTMYGGGELTLTPMFQDAWKGAQSHSIKGPGTNRIPTVHVRDLARLVRQIGLSAEGLNPLESVPYFLALDQPPAPEGARSQPPTQADIVQGIVNELGNGYHVPIVDAYPEEVPEDLQQELALDLQMEPSASMLAEEFAAASEPPGWWCRTGFLANIRTVATEFCTEKKLQCIRVVVAGPPASGTSSLAEFISTHFNVPKLTLDPEAIDDMAAMLASNVCHYRGYVLDVSGIGYEQADKLFRKEVEVPPSDEDPPPAEGEPVEKKFTREMNSDIAPDFIIVTQAPEAVCLGHWQARGLGTASDFQTAMQQYQQANLTEGVPTLTDFFQSAASMGVLNLPISGKDEEDINESARIYLERAGRPFNYLPGEDEVAAEIRAWRAEKVQAAKEAAEAAQAAHQADDDKEFQSAKQRHDEYLAQVAEHEAAHRHLQELPLREYLVRYVVPDLTEGLIDMCKVLPDNPLQYLAHFIEERAAEP